MHLPKLCANPLFVTCCGANARDLPKLPKRRVATVSSPKTVSTSDTCRTTPPSPREDLSSLELIVSGTHLDVFSLEDLNRITRGFSNSNFVGKGGFGPVYRGCIDQKVQPTRVAVKLLDHEGLQGHKEWLAEVRCLGKLRHPNLVKLIGYCCENEHRLLVYEFIANGSLEDHLFNNVLTPLSWHKRLKIAVAAAKGLCFLHEAEKPVIHRDFKPSNILLDNDYEAKLSDFGLAKDGPQGDDTHVSTRIMGSSGYAAPEYIMTGYNTLILTIIWHEVICFLLHLPDKSTRLHALNLPGHLTTKSDVYSFGVVLLELLTGKRSVDKTRPNRKRDLVEWSKRYLRDPQKLHRIMDPRLEDCYSTIGAQRVAALACQCISRNPKTRPDMKTIVTSLEPLLELRDIPMASCAYTIVADDRIVEMEIKHKE
ncbi:hypothetical protein HPP92_018545 [Vanilla planifolia]|uniref:non-specific serine/threonine protein kinase n=1 Tax=Vanilla planifolia TaxID=51239 RepID=A0A835QHS5_VANPL|nr:hypothetical protein HPP92_018545 [Vanilla planifolia]